MFVDASLPPARTCPGYSAPNPADAGGKIGKSCVSLGFRASEAWESPDLAERSSIERRPRNPLSAFKSCEPENLKHKM